jgi:Mg2+-importing ATPase
MARKRVIVKRLSAIENFGSMNVLCADKTGTLTEGTLRLVGCYAPDGCESDDVLALAALNAALQAGLPSPIDDTIREACRPRELPAKVDEVPYDFARKRISVLTQELHGRRRLVTKGALAKVLEICTQARRGGETVPLSAVQGDIDRLFAQWSERGLRVLGVAERDIAPGRARIDETDEVDMTFAGFVTFSDVPKPRVAATIARLARLGIGLKIITGDNPKVAATVAQQVGIAEPRLLTGDELRNLSPEALAVRAAATDVFAEIEPNQKERIIIALKRGGNVVGFIGDGINDAPALHTADVGISVDQAVDVAKEAAEIVLLDPELDVLAEGVLQGRHTFLNTLKYIYITSSANFGNMLSMAFGLLFLPFLPLLPHQILLNNFLSDLPAMTIGNDRVDPEATQRPRRWHVRSIRDFMIVFGAISSVFDLVTFATLLFVFHAAQDEFRSAWFMVSLFTEVLILLIMRTRRSFFRSAPSKALLVTSAATAVACVALVCLPAAATELGFAAPPAKLLVAVAMITTAYGLVSERAKLWFFGHPRYDDTFDT